VLEESQVIARVAVF